MRSDFTATFFKSFRFTLKPDGFFRFILFCLVLPGVLPACSGGKSSTGPAAVRWDREICVRCAMAVGDRHYTAQIRGGEQGQKLKVYKFDDIGCAVVWLQDQPWNDRPDTEIWVNDYNDGDWLDAKTASYVKGRATPMDYGLGAQKQGGVDTLSFEQARAHILEVDKRYQVSDNHASESPAPGGVTQQ